MISGSAKRLNKNGSTSSSVSGPPKFNNKTPTRSSFAFRICEFQSMETEVVAFSNAVAAETTFFIRGGGRGGGERSHVARMRARLLSTSSSSSITVVTTFASSRDVVHDVIRVQNPPSFVVAFSAAFPDFYFDETKDEW